MRGNAYLNIRYAESKPRQMFTWFWSDAPSPCKHLCAHILISLSFDVKVSITCLSRRNRPTLCRHFERAWESRVWQEVSLWHALEGWQVCSSLKYLRLSSVYTSSWMFKRSSTRTRALALALALMCQGSSLRVINDSCLSSEWTVLYIRVCIQHLCGIRF